MDTHQGNTGHDARGNKTQKLPEIDNFSWGKGWFCGRKRMGIGKKEKNREERNEEKWNNGEAKWNTAGEAHTYSPLTPFPILY